MYEHVMVETLSGTFNAILGGNAHNVMLHVNAATLTPKNWENLSFYQKYVHLGENTFI